MDVTGSPLNRTNALNCGFHGLSGEYKSENEVLIFSFENEKWIRKKLLTARKKLLEILKKLKNTGKKSNVEINCFLCHYGLV